MFALRAACAAVVSALLFSNAPARAADGQAAAAPAIDRECADSVDRVLGGEPLAFGRIFANDDAGAWRVADAGMLHRIVVDPNIYSEVAKTWSLDGHVVLVNVEERSLDIEAHSTYCFRLSGTLARVSESTSGMRVRDDETRYFDLGGSLVGSQSHFYNIYSNLGNAISADLRPSTPSLYMSVEMLPFYALMRTGAPK
jgi:hypothetical protein